MFEVVNKGLFAIGVHSNISTIKKSIKNLNLITSQKVKPFENFVSLNQTRAIFRRFWQTININLNISWILLQRIFLVIDWYVLLNLWKNHILFETWHLYNH